MFLSLCSLLSRRAFFVQRCIPSYTFAVLCFRRTRQLQHNIQNSLSLFVSRSSPSTGCSGHSVICFSPRKVLTWGDSTTLSTPEHHEPRTNDKTDKFYFHNISLFNANLYYTSELGIRLFFSFSIHSTYIFSFLFLIWITTSS